MAEDKNIKLGPKVEKEVELLVSALNCCLIEYDCHPDIVVVNSSECE